MVKQTVSNKQCKQFSSKTTGKWMKIMKNIVKKGVKELEEEKLRKINNYPLVVKKENNFKDKKVREKTERFRTSPQA